MSEIETKQESAPVTTKLSPENRQIIHEAKAAVERANAKVAAAETKAEDTEARLRERDVAYEELAVRSHRTQEMFDDCFHSYEDRIAERDNALGKASVFARALERLASGGCRFHFGGQPRTFSCVDRFRQASDSSWVATKELREQILRLEIQICDPCYAKLVLNGEYVPAVKDIVADSV